MAIMAEQAESSVCPKCNELERRVAALESQLADALSRLAAATKNSGNSSKPPSSDIVKAALVGRKKKQKKRKKGAQPGHPKHERPAFPPEHVDKTEDYAFDACPECGGKLKVLDQPASVVQQIEVVTQLRGDYGCYRNSRCVILAAPFSRMGARFIPSPGRMVSTSPEGIVTARARLWVSHTGFPGSTFSGDIPKASESTLPC